MRSADTPHSACAPLEKPLELEMKWNKKI